MKLEKCKDLNGMSCIRSIVISFALNGTFSKIKYENFEESYRKSAWLTFLFPKMIFDEINFPVKIFIILEKPLLRFVDKKFYLFYCLVITRYLNTRFNKSSIL